MPLIKNNNGQWVNQGTGGDTTAYSPEVEEQKKKKQQAAKPWWQKVVNDLSYEAKRVQQNPIGAANTYRENVGRYAAENLPNPNPIARGVGTLVTSKNPLNDLRYEVSQLTNPSKAIPRLSQYGGSIIPGQGGVNLRLGATQAAANVARNVLDLGAGDYTDKGGGALDDFVDESYRASGHTAPSEMTDAEKGVDDFRASMVLNLGAGAALEGLGGALSSLKYVGPLAQRLAGALNVNNAKTFWGAATRMAAGLSLEEMISTPLDDNTGGSFGGLVGLETVKPNMTRAEATAAAFLPNLAGSALMVGGIGGLGKLLQSMPNTKRAMQADSLRARRAAERETQKTDGVIQEDDTGRAAFTEETLQSGKAPAPAPVEASPSPVQPDAAASVQAPRDFAQEEAAFKEQFGIGTASASKAKSTDDPWEMEYDPSIPESDAFGELLNQASDDQLKEIAQADGDIVATADAVISRPGEGYDPTARLENASAPKEVLAETGVDWSDRLGQVSTDRLLSLAHPDNSNELYEAIVAQTGKDWQQFDRTDVLAGLRQLEGQGQAVLANRLMGAPMLPVGDIAVDPKRFQFKNNVDQQGRQRGNSLEGVERWNPDMEDSIQVWEDAADGKTYVVNGHNRLAMASRMGIPSMRVEYLTAGSDIDARAQGALNNIANNRGTVLDAAKFFRASGIVDADALAQRGIALNKESKNAIDGLALSRLPDGLFDKVVSGELSEARGVALGGSSLDPEGMFRVAQLAEGRDMTERAFRELTQMAETAPKVESDQMGLFGPEVIDTTVIKAELAAKVRTDLASSKRLLAMAGKPKNAAKLADKAGATVDAGQAQDAASLVEGVIQEFDQTKYAADTPLSNLLNEAAAQIAGGAKRNVLARRIVAQLEGAAEVSPPAPVARGEADAPTPEAAVEPRELTLKERRAIKSEIVARAAQNGEVRPPSTPLIPTPARSTVSLEKVASDLDQNVLTPDVLQAADDELRLAAEHKRLDDAIQADVVKAEREAIGYEDMTFQERKGMGLADGLELKTPDTAEEKMAFVRQMRARAEKAGDMVLAREFRNAEIRLQRQMAESPEVLPPERATPLADTFESMARESARADAEVFRRVGLDIDRTQRGLDDLAEILSKPDGTPLPPTKAKKALETRVAQLENEIETVKRQAAEEGC